MAWANSFSPDYLIPKFSVRRPKMPPLAENDCLGHSHSFPSKNTSLHLYFPSMLLSLRPSFPVTNFWLVGANRFRLNLPSMPMPGEYLLRSRKNVIATQAQTSKHCKVVCSINAVFSTAWCNAVTPTVSHAHLRKATTKRMKFVHDHATH